MRSMTGYGSGVSESKENDLSVQIEITSLNRKTLDVQLSCPKEWNGLEKQCTDWLKGAFERGRVNVQIKVTQASAEESPLACNEPLIEKALERLKSISSSQGVDFTPDAQLLFQMAQTLKDCSGLPSWQEIESTIHHAFDTALSDLNAMRTREGLALKDDIQARVEKMSALTSDIESAAQETTKNYKNKLLDRLSEMNLELDLQDERVLKEVALFADRSDISEEITRLKSHFEQFLELTAQSEPSGRKMDFLCQEIHREFNTTGSKAQDIQIKRSVIDAKNELERIREQVQNVE